MNNTISSRWLYYKIYLGGVTSKVDHLITGAFPQIRDREEISHWFFLHYTDEGGPHVRLRLKTDGETATLRRAVDPVLTRALAELPALPSTPYRPTILPPAAPRDAPTPEPGRPQSMRVELDRYEPDVESFGERGVAIAEELFHASSEVALGMLADEQRHRYSRKTVAPLLMQATVEAFMPEAGRALWTDYSAYWLDWSPEFGDVWRARFVAKANALRERGVPILAPDDQLAAEAGRLLSAWRSSTVAAAWAFRAAGDQPARSARDLTFHFLHTMNNRLGLMPIEEAYLATLIAESVDGERGA